MIRKILSVNFWKRERRPKKIKVQEIVSLSPQHRMVAVEASGYVYLLGLHPQGMLPLAEYDIRMWEGRKLTRDEELEIIFDGEEKIRMREMKGGRFH